MIRLLLLLFVTLCNDGLCCFDRPPDLLFDLCCVNVPLSSRTCFGCLRVSSVQSVVQSSIDIAPSFSASTSQRKVKVEAFSRRPEEMQNPEYHTQALIHPIRFRQDGENKEEKKTEKLNYKTPQDHIQSKYVSQVFSQSTWKDFVLFFIFGSFIPCTHNLEIGKNAAVYRFFLLNFLNELFVKPLCEKWFLLSPPPSPLPPKHHSEMHIRMVRRNKDDKSLARCDYKTLRLAVCFVTSEKRSLSLRVLVRIVGETETGAGAAEDSTSTKCLSYHQNIEQNGKHKWYGNKT